MNIAWYGLQETEIVTAGFPCIDVSRAGKREGFAGMVRFFGLVQLYEAHVHIVTRCAVAAHLTGDACIQTSGKGCT